MSWTNARMVAFDLETTAANPDEARIVTIAHVDIRPVDPGDGTTAYQVDRWSALVNPGVPIPDEAAAIHGITTEKAQAEGEDPAEISGAIAALLDQGWHDGAAVVGHNVVYDLTVLDRELRRHHGRSLDVNGPVIDTLCLDRAVDRFRKGKRTLTAACQHYDVRLDGAHDATEDALASARIAWRIARQYPGIGAMTLAELQDYQRDHYREWAEGFEDYLKKTKRRAGEPQHVIDAVHIDRDWPLRRFPEAKAA